jgi:hypothetical protein
MELTDPIMTPMSIPFRIACGCDWPNTATYRSPTAAMMAAEVDTLRNDFFVSDVKFIEKCL